MRWQDSRPAAYLVSLLPVVPLSLLFLVLEATHDLPLLLNPYYVFPLAVIVWAALAPRPWVVTPLLVAFGVILWTVPVEECNDHLASCAEPLARGVAPFLLYLAIFAAVGGAGAIAVRLLRPRPNPS